MFLDVVCPTDILCLNKAFVESYLRRIYKSKSFGMVAVYSTTKSWERNVQVDDVYFISHRRDMLKDSTINSKQIEREESAKPCLVLPTWHTWPRIAYHRLYWRKQMGEIRYHSTIELFRQHYLYQRHSNGMILKAITMVASCLLWVHNRLLYHILTRHH